MSMGQRAIESAEKIGSVLARMFAHGVYGMGLRLNAEWEGARHNLEKSLEIARAHRVGLFMEADFMVALGEAHLGSGEVRRARELAEESFVSVFDSVVSKRIPSNKGSRARV